MHKKSANVWVILALLLIFALSVLAFHNKNSKVDCTDGYRQDSIILAPNGTQLAVEISADRKSQAKGLSGRECIAKDWAMLFSFKEPAIKNFWMKNMQFNIDIVWIDENLKVIGVEKDVSPSTYPKTFPSPTPVKYVLELGANQAEALGIQSGSSLTF